MVSDGPSGERVALDGRTDWTKAIREALLALPEQSAREAALVDVDFDAWPLGEPAVVDAFTRWLRMPGRRLLMLGLRFDALTRTQPRFAQWRRSFTHAMEVATPEEMEPDDMPCLLVVPRPALAIELVDREHFRGRVSRDPKEVRLANDRIAAISQRSGPAWPANALGL